MDALVLLSRTFLVSYSEALHLPCQHFLALVERAGRERALEERSAWLRAAFVGWQVTSALTGKRTTFREYLRKLGLEGWLRG